MGFFADKSNGAVEHDWITCEKDSEKGHLQQTI